MTSFDLHTCADLLARVCEQRAEPDWLIELRMRALRRANELCDEFTLDQPLPDVGALLTAGEGVAGDAPVRSDVDGVLFCDLATAARQHPDLVRRHLGTLIGSATDALGALNTAVWMHGWFVHVSPGVRVDRPVQIDVVGEQRRIGPFDRTLIVVEHGASVRLVDGCSAPLYTPDTVQAGVVEIVVQPGASVGYSAIQNWSTHVDNQAAKRARVEAGAQLDWVEGNLGARCTRRRPAIELAGSGASTTVHSLALAGPGQHHATGADVTHAASDTTSTIVARSILRGDGATTIGAVDLADGLPGASSSVDSDALLLDGASLPTEVHRGASSSTGPSVVRSSSVTRLSDEQLLYLASRGLTDSSSTALVVGGFIEPITRHLDVEDTVEWSRLIELQVVDSIG